MKSRWRYLEASPEGWNDGEVDPASIWCSSAKVFVKSSLTGNTLLKRVTSGLVGSGAKNTNSMLATCSDGAANVSATYRGSGYSDWYLPSKEELKLMFKYRDLIGGFESGPYGLQLRLVLDIQSLRTLKMERRFLLKNAAQNLFVQFELFD